MVNWTVRARTAVWLAHIGLAESLVVRPVTAQQPNEPRIGHERAIPNHWQDGQEFRKPLADIVAYGGKLFTANWTEQDGAGRPLTKGTGKPLTDPSRPLRGAREFNRLSGPDANSCASDSHGNTARQGFKVTVADTTAPLIARVAADRTELWPPNHKFVPVTISVTASDAVSANPVCAITSVASSEGETDSWRVTGALTLDLMAARKGTAPSREYSIRVSCHDAAGNVSAEAQTTVTVRHDQSWKKN